MDSDNALNAQNAFFNQVRKDRSRVMLSLMGGQKVIGTVKSFDRYTILLDTRNGEQMVFKHAIASVGVLRPGDRGERGGSKLGDLVDLKGAKEP